MLPELRHRRVFRTATMYAVAGWAVAQLVATLAPVLLLPDWFARAVVFLIILGFPVAVGLAWAFDVTPTGIRRARSGARTSPSLRPLHGDPRYEALVEALGLQDVPRRPSASSASSSPAGASASPAAAMNWR